jgi:frataxin
MLDESHFHAAGDATLTHLFDQLEEAFEAGTIDELELSNSILQIETPCGKIFIISKHAPSRQIWLASPLSGGHHFTYHASHQHWQSNNGHTLNDLLRAELHQLGVRVVL